MPDKTDTPQVGGKIRHPDWGGGKVLGLLRGGRVIRVEFDEMAGTPWEIPREELEYPTPETSKVPEPPEAPEASEVPEVPETLKIPEPPGDPSSLQPKKRVPRATRKKPTPPSQKNAKKADKAPVRQMDPQATTPAMQDAQDAVNARQAIEALRLGVVPSTHLDTYTVGRDMELVVIYQDLKYAAQDGGFRVVLGDYGTGKTHFLEMAEMLALGEGFLATRATLDSQEVLPNKPRRIFHQLARGIRYPDDPNLEPRGLRPLLEKAATDIHLIRRWSGKNRPDYHPYLGPALFYAAVLPKIENHEDIFDHLLDWIEGSEVASNMDLDRVLRRVGAGRSRLYALKDFRTVTHLYTLILGGVAELARQVGYKGLAIMVDEAEFYSVLRGQDRTFADILFRTVAAACLPRSLLRFDPAVLPKGGQAIHRRFSYRFKDDQPLYCLFALTHDPEGKAALEESLPANRFMELAPFRTEDYVTLSKRVLSLYERAYDDLAPGNELASLMARVIEPCHQRGLIDNPRQALKFITEVMDITRHRPDRLVPMLKTLLEHLRSAL